MLSVVDLGIIRHVRAEEGGIHVGVSPTYSGCPATEVIRGLIERQLRSAGFENVQIDDVLSPPWSSDWISAEGHRKLKAFGIAPPEKTVSQCASPVRRADRRLSALRFDAYPARQ